MTSSIRISIRTGITYAILASACLAGRANPDGDITIIWERVTGALLSEKPNLRQAKLITSRLMDSGQFSDVNYGDTDPANWDPNKHVAVIRVMPLAWASGTTSAEDKILLLPAILHAYNWWTNSRPKSSNWWWNQIRIPVLLGESMLLLKDQLGMWQPAGWKRVLRHED